MKKHISILTLILIVLNLGCTQESKETDGIIDSLFQEVQNNPHDLLKASDIYKKKENEDLNDIINKDSKAKLYYIDALYYRSINKRDSAVITLEKGFNLLKKHSDLKFNIALLAAESAARIPDQEKMDRFYKYCLAYALKKQNPVQIAQCKSVYALYYMTENKYVDALSFLQSADSILRVHHITIHRDYYQYLLGYNNEKRSFNSKAYEHYIKSMALCDSTNNAFRKLQNYQRIVSLYRKDNRFDEALKWQIQKLELVKQSNNSRMLRESYEGLGIIYTEMKDWDNGERYFKESLKCARESNVKSGIATSLTNLGNFYIEKGSYKQAVQILDEVYDYKLKINASYASRIKTLNSLAKTYMALNNNSMAHKYFNMSLQLCDSTESVYLKSITNKQVYTLYKKEKKYAEAINYITAYLKYEKEHELRKSSEKLKDLMVRYETQQKEKKIAIQKEELKSSRLVIAALISIVVLIIVILILFVLNKKVRKKAIESIYKQHLQVQNKQDIINQLLKEKNIHNTQNNENILLSQLLALLEDDKIFRRQDLTLEILAKKLNTNITYVSQIINKEFDCNFNTLINRYRISYCKKHIESHKHSKILMKQLGFESGFASQSTFYSAFKTEVGMTPLQFQKAILLSE
ncbi:tetratricopeptide repeat protein [Plebeiibacterium sediminum]|uniref:Tetratricopeptide repeat protein n=1 Tax=Plebeiibacterium sediminum TaxID=2992112 RepID=A0AAE3M4G3_9BACT|nr:tetratricopeptide repeat protein [Plebeiobacterium sediminum]MCW3786964.1 tetratricopeptide repeat protein [Plebeiobacterium sediminum]